MSAFVGLGVTLRYSPPPLPPSLPPSPLLFLLLCFCADEIKDDFDTLGPDATMQAVGNGTGELTHDVFFFFFFSFVCVALLVRPFNPHCNMI